MQNKWRGSFSTERTDSWSGRYMFTLEWDVGERLVRRHEVEGVLLRRTVIVREAKGESIYC